jgi:hypothetical protein
LNAIENDPALYKDRVIQYKQILDRILSTSITKSDSEEEIMAKISETIDTLKKKKILL